jgi:prophage antirepressor-like protein
VTALQSFQFGHCRVRTAGTADAPLFCASDVCDVLTLGNVSKACSRLDQDEVELIHHEAAKNEPKALTVRGDKRVLYVTESGLFSLILGCEKPEARAFKKWVTSEVLPAIRRRGYYDALDADREKQTARLLEVCFPHAPSTAKPLFSELISELLKMRHEERRAGNPPWAPLLAQIVYDLAIPIDGQQAERRRRNATRTANRPDHSMFSDELRQHVENVARVGIAMARNSFTWNEWRARMDTSFRNAPLQLSLLTPIRRLPPRKAS